MSDAVEEKETTDVSIDEMVRIYIKIRDHKRKLESEFAAKEEAINAQLETIEEHFRERCKQIGAQNIKIMVQRTSLTVQVEQFHQFHFVEMLQD